jgi:hypothetical protein
MGFSLCKGKANPVAESEKRKVEQGQRHLISYESNVYTLAVLCANYHIKGESCGGVTKIRQSDIMYFTVPNRYMPTVMPCSFKKHGYSKTHIIVQYCVTSSVLISSE